MIQNEILKKYLEGNASDIEKEKVMLWIEASPEHAKEFMKLRRLYDIELFLKPKYTSTTIQEKNSNSGFIKKKKSTFKLVKIATRVAAFIALVLVSTYVLNIYNPFNIRTSSIQTLIVPAGQRAKLVLCDSTVIWINANSKLTYSSNFNSKTRDVTLIGEGYFDVKHNSKKPFIVHTKNYDIKDLGTEFNVIAYDNSDYFETSLLKGSISLYNQKKQLITLIPNERVFTKEGKIYQDIISDKCHFMWREGIIAINDKSVSELLSELELIFDTKVINYNNQLNDIRYTGKFRTADGIEHVLKVLQLNCKFKYKIIDDGNKIIIN